VRIDGDDGLSALIAAEEESHPCGGFTFTEGPVWVPGDGCLLFSDIPADTIHRWRPGMAEAEVYRRPSRNSNGLTLDHTGNVLACEHSGRRVSRAPYGGPETTLVDAFEGKRLNSPNDLVVHSSGAVFFTDPTYGLGKDGAKELPYQGIYKLAPDGALTLLDDSFTQPNGLAFSPDETVLYVSDSAEKIVRRFGIEEDGTIDGGEVFVDMRGDGRPGPPHGMKVDETGRLWTTGAGGVWVVEPDGRVLGVLELPRYPANLAFGGPDFSTLYLTCHEDVYAVETAVRGIAPGSR
jgi:gluconolactonase